MAYTRGAWRGRGHGKPKVLLGMQVPAGFQGRLQAIANRMVGVWDMTGVVELAVEVLERALEGRVDLRDRCYPKQMNREDLIEFLKDAGKGGEKLTEDYIRSRMVGGAVKVEEGGQGGQEVFEGEVTFVSAMDIGKEKP